MGTFGLRLRSEREKKGMRLVDVAKATRVGVHHLAALEHENFADLPNEVFVKGYIRVYAECVGLDPDEMVTQYLEASGGRRPESEPGATEDEVVREMSRLLVTDADRTGRFRAGHLAATGGLVVLLLLVAWAWTASRRGEPSVASTRASPPQLSDASTERAAEPVARPRPPATPVSKPPASPVGDAQDPPPPQETRPLPETSPPRSTRPAPAPESKVVSASRLEIDQDGIGTGVENRNLVGEADRFRAGTQVYYWMRVTGGRAGDEIRHVWYHEGVRVSATTLRIGGSHWRTQSRKTLSERGRWSVEATDAAGNVLARREVESF